MRIKLPTITPLHYQLPSWRAIDRGIMRKIISYPRRHGKDFEDLSLAARDAILRKGTYFYIFPTRKWAKRAIWDTVVEIGGEAKFLIDHIFPKEIVVRKNETDLFLELINGSMFFMGGSDNLDFVGQGGQGYTLSEFSLHKAAVTSLLSPIIRQSQAYIRMNGTLRGKDNPLWDIYSRNKDNPKWHARWLKPEHTKLYSWVNDEMNINPELIPLIDKIDPRTGKVFVNCQGVPYSNIQDDIDSGMCSYIFARQEYLNDIVSHVTGGYYGYEMKACRDRGAMKAVDPFREPVYTFWDLGGAKEEADSTSIVFAHVDVLGGTATVVDYYENTGKLRGHYFEVLAEKGYTYAGHYYPHDGKRTNEWTGETSADTARNEFGVEIRFVPKTNKTAGDIEVTRRGFVNTSFGKERTEKLLTHLDNYHQNGTTEAPCHKNNCSECHGASHGADAFRCFRMAIHLNLVEPYLLETRSNYRRETVQEYVDEDWMCV